jgi:hypothetical protein
MERLTSVTKDISDAEKYEAYLVYHRKSYDKHRDKILAIKREKYVPTGRSVGRPRKEHVVNNSNLQENTMEATSISS